MKYIVFEKEDGNQFLVAFSPNISHDDMAESLLRGVGKPVSAGFIRESADGFYCGGESVSLGVKSHEDDTFLLRAGLASV